MDYGNLVLWIAGILIAIALGSLVFGGSKKSLKIAKWTGVIGAVGLLTLVPFVATNLPFLSNQINLGDSTLAVGDSGTGGVGTTPSTGSGSVIAGGCIYDGLSPKISGKNIITGASTGGSNAYQVLKNGVVTVTTSVSDGATISADYGDVVKVLYGNESNNLGFFGKVKEFTLPFDK